MLSLKKLFHIFFKFLYKIFGDLKKRYKIISVLLVYLKMFIYIIYYKMTFVVLVTLRFIIELLLEITPYFNSKKLKSLTNFLISIAKSENPYIYTFIFIIILLISFICYNASFIYYFLIIKIL